MTRADCDGLGHAPTLSNMIGIGNSKSDAVHQIEHFAVVWFDNQVRHFQIWTRETLQQYGFEPRSAAYYVVLHFDPSKSIPLKQHPNLKEDKYTFKAKIRPLSDFLGIK